MIYQLYPTSAIADLR